MTNTDFTEPTHAAAGAHDGSAAWRLRLPALAWLVTLAGAAGLGAAWLAAAAGAGALAPVATVALLALACAPVLWFLPDAHHHDRLGAANAVTLVRLGLVALLAGALAWPGAALADPALAWGLAGIATVALILDGVDGWLARRSGMTSRFGAWLDMEVDLALTLVLALLVVAQGAAGVWIVAIAGLHPAFVLAGRRWPALRAPLPDAFWRKAVCVGQIVALIAMLSPLLAPPASGWLGAAVLALVAGAFLRDILWLLRQARRTASA